MLALVCAVVLSTPVPSAGAMVLARLLEPGPLLLAQSPDPDAERELEEDMERERRRLGREDGGAQEPIPEPTKRSKKRSRKVRTTEPVLIEGHGKAYFLTWGIVDWAIAAEMWGIGAWLGLEALAFASMPDDGSSPLSRETSRKVSGVLGIGSIALGLAGVVVALRAGPNLQTFRELRAQERAQLERSLGTQTL